MLEYFILIFICYLYYLSKKNILRHPKRTFNCTNVKLTNIVDSIFRTVEYKNVNTNIYTKSIILLKNNNKKYYRLNLVNTKIYSLIVIKNVYITDRVIIHKCKILLFKGQCNDNSWYKNNIKLMSKIPTINHGINIINWHGDGVFHGTVEGITRILPFLNILLNKSNLYLFLPFPRYTQDTSANLLELLGFSKNKIKHGNYFVKQLYTPLPFYCVESSTYMIRTFNDLIRTQMKKRQCKVLGKKYILILQRSKNRILINIDVLIYELKKKFNYSIIVYYDRYKILKDIYCWFTYAAVVIGYHGSGLTNIYFCNTNTTVIELSPSNPIYAFAKIGSQLMLNYYIYTLSYKLLYIKNISFNISLFITTISFLLK